MDTGVLTPIRPVVGRFAPSPTGPLHLGSLVAAVGSYVLARRAGGRWLVRIDDLDGPRVVPGMADDHLRTLEALGFEWDGEVVRQSRRQEAYAEALSRLEALGAVYPCGCSRAEIARASTVPPTAESGPIYPGSCRGGLLPGRVARSVRVRLGTDPVSFVDRIQGRVQVDLAATSGDFVVKRADGPFAYHLAVVVDDAETGIGQVVRGADLLGSTPRQIHLQRLLGLPTPDYAHLPLVLGEGGAKLSKRDHAISVASLGRRGGELVFEALCFLGQRPPVGLRGAEGRAVLAWAEAHLDPASIPPDAAPFRGRSPRPANPDRRR